MFPWSSVTCRPKSTETDVLGWPLTVITLLDPGFETMRSDWPSQMIVNETVKWFVGSAPAPGARTIRPNDAEAKAQAIKRRIGFLRSWNGQLCAVVTKMSKRRTGVWHRGVSQRPRDGEVRLVCASVRECPRAPAAQG